MTSLIGRSYNHAVSAAPSPFLTGAVSWLYGGAVPERCEVCEFVWSTSVGDALSIIAAAPAKYAELLDGRDGMVTPADGGWNATSYVWHLTDLARGWSERWVQLAAHPAAPFASWDPDELADARNYRNMPTVSALWALQDAVEVFVSLSEPFDPATTFTHAQWDFGNVGDTLVWLAHEFAHHQLDVAQRAG